MAWMGRGRGLSCLGIEGVCVKMVRSSIVQGRRMLMNLRETLGIDSTSPNVRCFYMKIYNS